MARTATPPPPARGPEEMSLGVGRLLTLGTFFGPALILATVGYAIGNVYTAAGLAVIWLAILFAPSIKFMRVRTFMVVERFGLLWDVKFSGPRLVVPFIDTVIYPGDFLQKQVELYMNGDHRIEIDFADGSAPVAAAAWYQIGNPVDIDSGNWAEVRKQVVRYVYRVRDEEKASRIAEIFQGAFRPYLESGLTVAEAQKDMEILARHGTVEAELALSEIGVWAFPNKGIIVRDIDLPETLIALREQALRGTMDAEEAARRSDGYWKPLEHIKKGLAAAGLTYTDQEVMNLLLAQRGFETLKETGSNVTLVGADVEGLLKTITVGSTTRSPTGGTGGRT